MINALIFPPELVCSLSRERYPADPPSQTLLCRLFDKKLNIAPPWHNPSQHSRKKDLHHRHRLWFMHTAWQVLCFPAAFVISKVQYLPNLDCIFRRGVHQSVIHHFVHYKWAGNWPLDSMIKVQFNLSDLLVSCCRKRVMDGGPIVSEAASQEVNKPQYSMI